MKNIIILIFAIIYFFNSNLQAMPSKISDKDLLNTWNFIKPDYFNEHKEPIYNQYQLILKDDGYYLLFDNIEYKVPDILDYGNADLRIYKKANKILALLGLVDFYGSVYFVYYIDNKELISLGDLYVKQPPTVEDIGMQKATFEVKSNQNKIIIHQYLGGKDYGIREFELKE